MIPYHRGLPAGVAACQTFARTVINESEMLVDIQAWRANRKDEKYWVLIKGINTTGTADGVELKISGEWKVTGTQAVKLAGGGQRTVFVLEPVPKK